MPQYILAFHGGHTPDTPEEVQEVMAQWQVWFEAMGDAVVQPGAPLGMSRTVSKDGVADGGGANPLSGYTVIKVADMDAAAEMAKGCPMVITGTGSVEVAEVVEM